MNDNENQYWNNPQQGYGYPMNNPQPGYGYPMNNPQSGYGYPMNNPQPGYGYPIPETKKKFVTASLVFGLLSAILLAVGVFVPAMDFSAFHESVQIRYNLMKICENIGLISDMWRGIPIGFLIAAALMAIFSFIRIPPLKAIPCMIVVILFILMIADVGNVVVYIRELIAKFVETQTSGGKASSVGAGMIWRSFLPGVYCLIAGLISGIISCFVSNKQMNMQ